MKFVPSASCEIRTRKGPPEHTEGLVGRLVAVRWLKWFKDVAYGRPSLSLSLFLLAKRTVDLSHAMGQEKVGGGRANSQV